MSELLIIIGGLLGILVLAQVALFVAYLFLKNYKIDENDLVVTNVRTEEKKSKQNYGKFHGVLTKGQIHDFLAFDEVKDGMIIRKNGNQYAMVIQGYGVNFDLSSDRDKISIEQGFQQFLNVLKFPIQLYVQTRMVNFGSIIDGYIEHANKLKDELNEITTKLDEAKSKGDDKEYTKLVFDRRRKENMYEYALDAIQTTENVSSNKNVLQRKNYIVVSYYKDDLGPRVDGYSREEIDNLVYSELITRAKTLIEALGASGVRGNVLNSEELMELIFAAYNRDDTEYIQIADYLASDYDELYAVSKNIYDKKKELLEKEISIDAINLVDQSIREADRERKQELLDLRTNRIRRVKEKARREAVKYKDNLMDERTYEIAKNKIDRAELSKDAFGNTVFDTNPEKRNLKVQKQNKNYSADKLEGTGINAMPEENISHDFEKRSKEFEDIEKRLGLTKEEKTEKEENSNNGSDDDENLQEKQTDSDYKYDEEYDPLTFEVAKKMAEEESHKNSEISSEDLIDNIKSDK